MYKFCMKCGTLLDTETGKCSKCDAQIVADEEETGVTEDLSKYAQVPQKVPAEPVPKPELPKENNGQVKTPAAVTKTGNKIKKNSVATILLSICVALFLLVGLLQLSVRNFLTEDNLAEVADDVKFSEFAEFVDDSDFIGIRYDDGEKVEFSEALYKNLQLDLEEETGQTVDVKVIKKAIDKTDLMDLMGEKISDYFSDIINNDEDFTLESNEVYDVLIRDVETILYEMGLPTHYASSKLCSDMSRSIAQKNVVDAITPETQKENNPEFYNTVQLALSWLMIFFVCSLVVLPMVLMFRRDRLQTAKICGYIFAIIGGIFASGGLIAVMHPTIWEIILGKAFFGAVIGGYLKNSLPIFGIILLIGIGMLLAHFFLLRKRK